MRQVARNRSSGYLGQRLELAVMALIALNILALILESIGPVEAALGEELRTFEVFSVGVFTLEYLVRLFLARRLSYLLRPMALIDLAAILPFYLALGTDLRSLRALRAMRLLRIAKMARYTNAHRILGRVLYSRKEQLLITTGFMLLLLLVASAAIYEIEHDVQPDAFSSIPASAWWAVSAMTTVGYGDVYPITAAGRVLGALISLLGIAFFALPAGILGSGFVQALEEKDYYCPNCGVPLQEKVPSVNAHQKGSLDRP